MKKRRLFILTALCALLISCSNNGSSEISNPSEPNTNAPTSGITTPATTDNLPAPSIPNPYISNTGIQNSDISPSNASTPAVSDFNKPSPDTPTSITQNTDMQYETAYNDILDAFRDYVYDASRDSQNENDFPTLDNYFGGLADGSEEVWFNFYTGIGFEVRFGLSIEYNMQNLGYAIKDINGDGVPELILLTRYHLDYYILGAFSYTNNKPQLLGGYWNRHTCLIDSSGLFYVHRSGGAWQGEWAIQQISADSYQLVDVKRFVRSSNYDSDSETMVVNGETYTPSESEIEVFFEEFKAVSEKRAELHFVPLSEFYGNTK